MHDVARHLTRREQAHRFNTLIDQALVTPSPQHQQRVLQLSNTNSIARLAERIRKRATLSGKRHRADTRQILTVRDELILALYASVVPQGWAYAWCDGSSIKSDSQRHAGIGGIVMDTSGAVIARISRAIGNQDAFSAELAALASVMSTALEHQLQRLWVYTDNVGMAQLWHEQRNDKRLAKIRELNVALERFALHTIPRLHNQPANALAKQAARNELYRQR